jgi:hypothetical protein
MDSLIDVRKIILVVDESWRDGGPRVERPLRVGVAAAVVRNPYAGRYFEDIRPFMGDLRPLGLDLSQRLLDALGGEAAEIQAYGKGAIVGIAGEVEHGNLWHEAGGWSMREVLKGPKAIVPSNTAVRSFGGRLTIPLGHIDAAYVRSHFQSTEMGVHDAPLPDEIVFGLAMATGPRLHERSGGLRAAEISVHDGQR